MNPIQLGEFLGVGVALPLAHDAQARLQMVSFEAAVRQSIWTVLGTAPGERVMRPDFGCGLNDLVFALNNAATAGSVATLVRDALSRFEPRIAVGNVQVTSAARGARLDIAIDYRILATDTAANLVYPFYLDRGAAA
ncbi:GPW/gp25 family protein [Nevskia sp.]|uniref:GPW/gp25 family protein n=1 Tax=Nevskia sp. TaxID=1929292 RepID=UPI0025D8AE74|nr:GPW/gp25 family protein [Nevskia sp.]